MVVEGAAAARRPKIPAVRLHFALTCLLVRRAGCTSPLTVHSTCAAGPATRLRHQARVPSGQPKPPCPHIPPTLSSTGAQKASETQGRQPGVREGARGLGEGPRVLHALPAWASPGPPLLGGSTPHPCLLFSGPLWPRRCLSWPPTTACGQWSSEPPVGRGAAQPGSGASILPSICPVPNTRGTTSMVDW